MSKNHPCQTRAALCILAIVLVLGSARQARAQVFESLGTRALGMGGAFVAVADDAQAVYWNPAGLANGAIFSSIVDRVADQRNFGEPPGGGLDTSATGGSGTAFAIGLPALGLSYYRLTFSEVRTLPPDPAALVLAGSRQTRVTTLSTRQAGITVLQSLAPFVHLGATLKYVRGAAGAQVESGDRPLEALLDRAGEVDSKVTHAVDLDAGVMVLAGPARFGIVGRNLRRPAFELPEGGEPIRLARQARMGLAITPRSGARPSSQWTTVAADLDLTRTPTANGPRRQVALGVERWLFAGRLGLRGGLRANTLDAARPAGSIGVSLGFTQGAWLEGQWTRGGRDGDRSWSLAARVARFSF